MKTFYIYLIASVLFILPSTGHAAAAETEKERHDKLVEGAKKEGVGGVLWVDYRK